MENIGAKVQIEIDLDLVHANRRDDPGGYCRAVWGSNESIGLHISSNLYQNLMFWYHNLPLAEILKCLCKTKNKQTILSGGFRDVVFSVRPEVTSW